MRSKRRLGHITDDENHAVRRALSETEARCKYEWKDARKSTCLYAVEAIKSKLRYYGFRV